MAIPIPSNDIKNSNVNIKESKLNVVIIFI